MNDQQIKQLKKAYEPLRGKKIATDKALKLGTMMDRVPKDALIKIYKADIPFVSTTALTTLYIKHNIKSSEIKEGVELDESLESDLTSLVKSGTIQITQGNAYTRSDFYKVLKPFKKWGKSWKRGDAIQIQMGKLVKESVLEEGFTPKEIKMAIGIASDKRYAGGNMTGAVNQIEKIKKGLSKHKQVAAVLRRQNESVEKIECPKCDGKGCSHCDDKGYHLKEGYLLEKVGSVKTPYGTVEIKKNPRAGRNQDGYIMVLHGKTKKHYLGSHPNPDDSAVNNIVKNAFKSGWLKEEVELEERNKELDYMIQRFKGVIDPDYEGDEDPDDILADIKKKFGSKVYNDLKKGQDKIHFGRPNHKMGIDRLADRKKTPSTKSGKADKRSVKALKSRIKFDRSMKSRKEEVELEEKKSVTQQIQDIERMLDRTRGNTSAVKMKRYALKKKLDKLMSMKEEAMTTNSGVAGLGKDGPADFFLKKRKNLVTKRYIEVNGKLKRREK